MPALTIQQAFELALQHHNAGQLSQAEALYRQILGVQPNHPDAIHFLGVLAHQMGQHDVAADLIGRAILLNPHNPGAYCNLGEVYRNLGRNEQAISAFRRALEIAPNSLLGYINLSHVLRDEKRFNEAHATLERAFELDPNCPELYNSLGLLLMTSNRIDDALTAYRRALGINARYPEACNNLGNAFLALGRFDDAITNYRIAIQLRPTFTTAYNNLCCVLMQLHRVDEVVTTCHSSIESQCANEEIYNHLGNARKEQGKLSEAIEAFRRALQVKADDPRIHSNLIYSLHFIPGEQLTIRTEERNWNRQFGGPHTPPAPQQCDFNPEREINIGYISPAFCDHVIGRNLFPLLKHHSSSGFKIFCYSDTKRADSLTDGLTKHADVWRNTLSLSDDELVQSIRNDHIDLLIDLSQHLDGNRLVAFTRWPAPIQISFAGYPDSSGVEAIRYRISDHWIEENGEENSDGLLVKTNGHEQVYLIDSFWCYDPCDLEVSINALPAQEARVITFGSLNNFCKVNDPLLKLWARVLKAVRNSRLVILAHKGSNRQRIQQFFETESIEPHRVEFVARCPRKEYLELYHHLDIVLDTFPYNGHTTSLDALWMGVPVVSLCGDDPVSRAGLSQLSNLGLSELVAFTEDQYVEIVAKLANDIPRLAELRAELRPRMEKSVLMDATHFTRQIEACYRSMWRQWCKSQKA